MTSPIALTLLATLAYPGDGAVASPSPGVCTVTGVGRAAPIRPTGPIPVDAPEYYAFSVVTTKRVPGTGLATGTGHVTFAASPFGIALAQDGSYVLDVWLSVDRLTPQRDGVYVAWITTPDLERIPPSGPRRRRRSGEWPSALEQVPAGRDARASGRRNGGHVDRPRRTTWHVPQRTDAHHGRARSLRAGELRGVRVRLILCGIPLANPFDARARRTARVSDMKSTPSNSSPRSRLRLPLILSPLLGFALPTALVAQLETMDHGPPGAMGEWRMPPMDMSMPMVPGLETAVPPVRPFLIAGDMDPAMFPEAEPSRRVVLDPGGHAGHRRVAGAPHDSRS